MFTEMTNNIEVIPAMQMWVLAALIWLVCKNAMWWTQAAGQRTGGAAAYFLTWPGMDPRPFARRIKGSVDVVAIIRGCAKLLAGVAFFLTALRIREPLFAGWVGMIGLILILHFGLFELLAVAWRVRGINVQPIMQRPMLASSLADFWSRWNRGFRDLAFQFVFRPLRRHLGSTDAMFATFVFSGIVHDIVISIPARGGFGMPTLYFVIQGLGVVFEKSILGRRVHPLIRRLMMYVILIAPLGLLFHTPFVLRVFVPFLQLFTRWNMTTDTLAPFLHLSTFIRIGGLMHFAILIASALVPQVLDWRGELRKLTPLTRQLVWVHGVFIVLTIIGLGAIAIVNAPLLAEGSLLARWICGFVAIFWLARVTLQFVLFDPKEYLTSALLKLGYHTLTFVFLYLGLTFAWAAVRWI